MQWLLLLHEEALCQLHIGRTLSVWKKDFVTFIDKKLDCENKSRAPAASSWTLEVAPGPTEMAHCS